MISLHIRICSFFYWGIGVSLLYLLELALFCSWLIWQSYCIKLMNFTFHPYSIYIFRYTYTALSETRLIQASCWLKTMKQSRLVLQAVLRRFSIVKSWVGFWDVENIDDVIGAPMPSRTTDLCITSATLYQLSYKGRPVGHQISGESVFYNASRKRRRRFCRQSWLLNLLRKLSGKFSGVAALPSGGRKNTRRWWLAVFETCLCILSQVSQIARKSLVSDHCRSRRIIATSIPQECLD